MTKIYYKPVYVQMECLREQNWDSGTTRDEPYAIFLGIDWTGVKEALTKTIDSNTSNFLNWMNHTDYSIDELKNKIITTYDKLKYLPSPKAFAKRSIVYYKVNEGSKRNDPKNFVPLTYNGHYQYTHAIEHLILVQGMEHDCSSPENIKNVLHNYIQTLGKALVYKCNFNQAQIIEETKGWMEFIIDITKMTNTVGALINEDDRIGSPKRLMLDSPTIRLTFEKENYGKYEYTFNIHTDIREK